MIVRILTEGQYNLPGAYIDELNAIDNELVDVVAEEDAEAFASVLKRMLDPCARKWRTRANRGTCGIRPGFA